MLTTSGCIFLFNEGPCIQAFTVRSERRPKLKPTFQAQIFYVRKIAIMVLGGFMNVNHSSDNRK